MTEELDKLKPSRSAAKMGERIDGLQKVVRAGAGLTEENNVIKKNN